MLHRLNMDHDSMGVKSSFVHRLYNHQIIRDDYQSDD